MKKGVVGRCAFSLLCHVFTFCANRFRILRSIDWAKPSCSSDLDRWTGRMAMSLQVHCLHRHAWHDLEVLDGFLCIYPPSNIRQSVKKGKNERCGRHGNIILSLFAGRIHLALIFCSFFGGPQKSNLKLLFLTTLLIRREVCNWTFMF